MKILKNPEIRGILTLVLIILVVAGVMAATTGKLEQWFGITLFSGPQALDKIVFVSEKDGGADIYLMNPDGSGAVRLTQNAKPESTPAISTAGNKILFVTDAGAMNQVFSVGVRGGRPSQVTTATGHKAEPSYSPNGKTMSFIASGKVYAAALDGNKLDPILPTPEEIRQSVVAVEGERGAQTLYSTYAWGPDGVSIAGVTKDGSGNDYLVYLPSLDGESARIPLAAPGTPVDIAYISWAAEKPVLAMAATVGKKGGLVMFDAEAGRHGVIIEKEGLEFGKPALSPDGSKIVICVNEKGKSGLINIDLTGGGITSLAMGVFENPVFSPAGDKVLATRIDGDKRDVVVIDPTDGQLTELTTDGKELQRYLDACVGEMMRLDNPYLTDQLIPYIGNKRKLLPLIHEAVSRTGSRGGTFFDAFAGSGVVSRMAKTMGFGVIANDWEPYSEKLNQVYIATNAPPEFRYLGGLENAIASLNALASVRGYIATHYCPAHDEHYDTATERMFYTQENGRRIDAMRGQIAQWRDSGQIDACEEAMLLAPLIYQASYCSNTSGVFKGFHRGWGGATKTAWYRIRSYLTLDVPVLFDNGLENLVLREDAAAAADKCDCNIAYIDPPYNQHQYGSNYHLLNTVALWDKPAIAEHISGNGHKDKAAIRMDWRTERRSPYRYKSTALQSFSDLVERLRADWILVSYSTEGIIPAEDLLGVLGERGELDVVVRQYKRYRVSSQRPSPKQHTTEFVAMVNTKAQKRPSQVSNAVSDSIVEKGQSG